MSAPSFEDAQHDLNPHRDEDRTRAAENIAGILHQRGVEVFGSETPSQLARILSAVEDFEQARARLGGDSMVNTPESSEPEDVAFVVPRRAADETVDHYIERIRTATEELLRRPD